MKVPEVFHRNLNSISRLSASRYFSFLECCLRELWNYDFTFKPLLPISPEARIGSVAHKVLEYAAKGILRTEESIQQTWNSEVQYIENIMNRSELDRSLIPLEKSSKNYDIKKYQTSIIAKRIINYFPSETTYTGNKPKIETTVRSTDGKVIGKIDLIRSSSDGIQIIDYKTGIIARQEEKQTVIKEEYKMQMLLYAALYQSTYNVWPKLLTLISLDGNEHNIDYKPEDALRLLREASSILDKTNKIITEGKPFEELGSPSPVHCKYCIFRPACKIYWKTKSYVDGWPVDVSGKLISLSILGNGFIRVEIQNGNSNFIVRGLDKNRLTGDAHTGDSLFIYNLKHDTVENYYISTPLTVCYEE